MCDISERLPLDIDRLRMRNQLFQLSVAAENMDARKADLTRQIRLERNAAQLMELFVEERIARESMEVFELESREVVLAGVAVAHTELELKRQLRQREHIRCDVKYNALQTRDEVTYDAQHHSEVAEGRIRLREERERATREAAERQANMARKQALAEEMRAARVYVCGDEVRQRADLVREESTLWKKIALLERQGIIDAKALEYDRFVNSDEQKQLAAERERKIAEEKAAIAKKEADFKKDQARMVSRCTHSRAGTSVFVGPLAKKMCLICKVKFDEAQGIYIRMP